MKGALYLIVGSLLALAWCSQDIRAEAKPGYDCSRMVTLAPSLTETAFALDLGENIVGVSKYSTWPSAAQRIPIVGALLDPNYESVIALKPTLVVALTEFREGIGYMKNLGLPTLVLEHRTVKDILQSFLDIGAACRREAKSRSLVQRISRDFKKVRESVSGRGRPRVMLVVGESSGDGALRNLFISGSDGFYNDLLEIAGGTNVFQQRTLGISSVSAEGALALKPDVIIEIVMANDAVKSNPEGIRLSWQKVPQIPAVRNGRVYVIAEDYASVPGPRMARLAEDFAKIIHSGASTW